jgi:nicotinamide riboside kinase
MRIAISGTASQGKSTLVKDFLNEWPEYNTTSSTYRDVIKAGNYPHSKSCNKDGQWAILNHMIDELQKYKPTDNVIFDRCPLDNLVYSLWSNSKEATDIDDKFIEKCIPIVKESMRLLDIIFFIPITKVAPIPIVDDGTREADPEYIAEIDNIFKAIIQHYTHGLSIDKFFPENDSPGIIEIFGSREQRIHLIRQYLNVDGDLIGDDYNSVLTPENLNQLESLLKSQKAAVESEKFAKDQKTMLYNFIKQNKKN